MKEVVMYGYGSFNDYKGQEHKVIVCALTRKVNNGYCPEVDSIRIYENEEDYDGKFARVVKTLSFGVAICNPIDKYDEEHGQTIAYNRAKSDTSQMLFSTRLGFFNTATVTSILNNYIEYIQKDPGSIISGYDEAKKKFYTEKDLKDDVSKMSEDLKAKMKILASCTPENIEYAKKIVKYIP